MILTPEQRGNIEMGLDVFRTDRQGASVSSRLWPGGVVAYDVAPYNECKKRNELSLSRMVLKVYMTRNFFLRFLRV